MNKLSKCPECSSTTKYRMKRKGLLKYIVNSKAYACYNCSNRYATINLLFFWKFSI